MRREFKSRDELIGYLRTEFPQAAAIDPHASPIIGGSLEAKRLLKQVNPRQYAATRNFLRGTVTRLSPYIRHGVISLRAVRQRAGKAYKLIQELAWRDYWQRLYALWGEGIWIDREPYKTGWTASDYAETLPSDITEGTTGLRCVDAFSRELRETGYLHNHARMWMASYIVHYRRVRWQAGARWFLQHLLDGDPASNNLSWQWVASTFSSKPYFFNRENLEKYTEGSYCAECPRRGRCDFEGSYGELEKRLFPRL